MEALICAPTLLCHFSKGNILIKAITIPSNYEKKIKEAVFLRGLLLVRILIQ